MNRLTLLACLLAMSLCIAAQGDEGEQILSNPDFDQGFNDENVPDGWARYGGGKPTVRIERTDDGVMLVDEDPGAEIGITRQVPITPSGRYRATATIRAVPDATSMGAYLQLRFVPTDNTLYQSALLFPANKDTATIEVYGNAPKDATHAQLYLYTHRDPTPRVIIERVTLERTGEAVDMDTVPQYDTLKDMHIDTALVADGQPNARIVVPEDRYRDDARRIQQAVRDRTGVTLEIVHDAPVPIDGHLILLGNRSTNRVIEQLYNFHYTLLDLYYPGRGGHVVRSLHNPFGGGHNVIFAGGSDDAGVAQAAAALADRIARAPANEQSLTLGYIADIHLPADVKLPTTLNETEIWEASYGYASTGYFGWNSISKHAAMFYMTGDEEHARQFLRLAFPDDEAKRQIEEIDGERIENKDDPLAGPYHYNAHMMILYWDLIEEHPFFTDEQRLNVTNAFARQFEHRRSEGVWRMQSPTARIGSRHGQWSAISLFALARYFHRDYGGGFWDQCLHGSRMAFRSLHNHAWVFGEADNHYWYSTGIAPIFTYLALSGEREPLEFGIMDELLAGQEILVRGEPAEPNIRFASLGFLHKAAYLTQDGRWLYYRDLTTLPIDTFRVGQSFMPEAHLQPYRPEHLVGKWSVRQLCEPEWRARNNGFPLNESFHFASYRSQAGPHGDYMLIDGYNGESRNPYHTFALLDLAIDGLQLIDGYHNQVLTRVDGMVEPVVAKNAALRHRAVVGETSIAVGEVPDAAYTNWRRTLIHRTGHYLLTIDELTPRITSDNMEAQVLWQPASTARDRVVAPGVVRLTGMNDQRMPPQTVRAMAIESELDSSMDDRKIIYSSILLRTKQVDDWLEMTFHLDEPVSGNAFVELLNYRDRGTVRIMLDGQTVVDSFNHHAARALDVTASLGHLQLAAGEHRLRVQTIALGEDGGGYIALKGLAVVPDDAPELDRSVTYDICLADPLPTDGSGDYNTFRWTGPARDGETRTLFSLIAENPGGAEPFVCNRLSDTTAIIAHRPGERALAIVGEAAEANAQVAVIGTDHLFALKATRVSLGGLQIRATRPVTIDWDFATGRAVVIADEAAEVDFGGGRVHTVVAGGTVELDDMPLPTAASRILATQLNAMFDAASASRRDAAPAGPAPIGALPALTPRFVANVGGTVDDVIVIPGDTPVIAAASGTKIELFDAQGVSIRSFNTDGPIRMLHWWPQHELLLAGCADEQVIAFNLAGERQWVFTSVMDPAVYRAAKTYWFKTAPGHEGIHGLSSGVFLNNESQCFVGSACTLEIINERGELVRRMPQFWGKVSLFQLIDGPNGSINLLTGRKYNGGHRLGIVNNVTLNSDRYGFNAVPPGVTYVGGWSSMNRHHLFYTDLDGDGEKEIVSEINGTWNRVTVWNREGTGLYDASFGPGESIPALNMMDIDVADLDADGKQEIVTATRAGLLVVLDSQCRKRWARALPSFVTVLAADDGVITAALASGDVMRFAADGTAIGRGEVNGYPRHIERLGDALIIATASGDIACFAIQ